MTAAELDLHSEPLEEISAVAWLQGHRLSYQLNIYETGRCGPSHKMWQGVQQLQQIHVFWDKASGDFSLWKQQSSLRQLISQRLSPTENHPSHPREEAVAEAPAQEIILKINTMQSSFSSLCDAVLACSPMKVLTVPMSNPRHTYSIYLAPHTLGRSHQHSTQSPTAGHCSAQLLHAHVRIHSQACCVHRPNPKSFQVLIQLEELCTFHQLVK